MLMGSGKFTERNNGGLIEVPSPSAMSYWPLTEAAGNPRLDLGRENHLTEYGTVGTRTGHVYPTMADFLPTTTRQGLYIPTGNTSEFGSGDCTYAYWFYQSGAAGYKYWRGIFGKGYEFGNYLFNDTSTDQIRYLNYGGWQGIGNFYSAHRLMIVRLSVGNTIRLQVDNGAVFDSGAVATNRTRAASAYTFSIGETDDLITPGNFPMPSPFSNLTVRSFNGAIGPAAFWERVLTDEECTEFWNGGSGHTWETLPAGLKV